MSAFWWLLLLPICLLAILPLLARFEDRVLRARPMDAADESPGV